MLLIMSQQDAYLAITFVGHGRHVPAIHGRKPIIRRGCVTD